jgi:uncharacterized membrane protein YGL010W
MDIVKELSFYAAYHSEIRNQLSGFWGGGGLFFH